MLKKITFGSYKDHTMGKQIFKDLKKNFSFKNISIENWEICQDSFMKRTTLFIVLELTGIHLKSLSDNARIRIRGFLKISCKPGKARFGYFKNWKIYANCKITPADRMLIVNYPCWTPTRTLWRYSRRSIIRSLTGEQ